jgi:hypothetical protein
MSIGFKKKDICPRATLVTRCALMPVPLSPSPSTKLSKNHKLKLTRKHDGHKSRHDAKAPAVRPTHPKVLSGGKNRKEFYFYFIYFFQFSPAGRRVRNKFKPLYDAWHAAFRAVNYRV